MKRLSFALVLALAATLFAAGAADAVLAFRINQANVAGVAPGATLRLPVGDGTCTQATFAGTIVLDTVTIPQVGGALFGGCRFAGIAATATQMNAWTISVLPLLGCSPSGPAICELRHVLTIPANGLRIASALCAFSVGGTVTVWQDIDPSAPLGQLVPIPRFRFAPNVAGLTVGAVAGCLGMVRAGMAVGATIDYTLAPVLFGTLVNLP